MNIAVVILNWNGLELLKEFLPKVIMFSPEAKIYVADNASTDESVTYVRQNHPEVSLIENPGNFGFAGGYNMALKEVKEDLLILLNSDVEVTRNWLKPMLRMFETEAETAAIQPKILDYYRKDYFEYAGAAGGYLDRYGYPYCRGRIFQSIEKDHGQYDENVDIFWASGACLAIRNSIFKKLEGFDEDFFAHQEEIDLCWRLQNKGYKVRYCGQSHIFHMGGATLSDMNPRKTYLNFRNNLFLLLKNLPRHEVYQKIFQRMILDGIAAFKFLFEGKLSHFLSILRAHGSFYSSFNRMKNKRGKFLKIRKYYHNRSIVYSHFVKGITKFSQL